MQRCSLGSDTAHEEAGVLPDDTCEKQALSPEGNRLASPLHRVGDLYDLQENDRLTSRRGRSLGACFKLSDSTSWVSHRTSLVFSHLKLEIAIPSLQGGRED